jgi:DNA helicase HerA-like ATPase
MVDDDDLLGANPFDDEGDDAPSDGASPDGASSDAAGDGAAPGGPEGSSDEKTPDAEMSDPEMPDAPVTGEATPEERSHRRATGDGASDEAAGAPEANGTGESDTTSIPEASVPSAVRTPADGEIGHVLASEEIRVSRSEYNVNVFITTDRRDTVRVGDYVQIPYPNSEDELFAVVDGLRYEPITELDDKSDMHGQIVRGRQVDESEYALVAELEPIATLKGPQGDDRERGLVNRVPKPNARVRFSQKDGDLRTGLNIPKSGIFAGHLSVGGEPIEVDGSRVPYYVQNPGIDPDTGEMESGEPAVFRHTLVAGSTGTGKTHFTKNLLRQFVDGKRYPVVTGPDTTEHRRLGIIIFDPENEYWQMGDDNPGVPDALQRRLREQKIKHGGVDNLEVYVPQVAHTQAPSTDESWPLTIPFSLVRQEPRLLMPFEQGSDVTRGAIRHCIEAYFNQLDDVDEARYTDFQHYLHQEKEALCTRYSIGEGTWSAVERRVFQQDYEDVFDTGVNPFPDLSDQIFKEGQVTVIPTSHLRGEKEYLVVLSILSYIIENKIDDFEVDEAVKNTPLLVAVDEAHNYFSRPDNIREEYIVGRAREAAKQGRKDQLGLMMITQNPEDIDEDVLKQTNTNVLLHLREEVVEDVPSVPRGYRRDIPKFGKGQAVIKAPDVEAVEVTGLPYCLTRHDN